MKKSFQLVVIVLLFVSCNNTKNSTNNKSEKYWQAVSEKERPEKYAEFQVFKLNEDEFIESLKTLKVNLPDENGKINSFSIEESQTMSIELANKFPNIKSYKGIKNNYGLCSPRIDTKKSDIDNRIKIAVFCNDLSYYIGKDKELGIYIVYTKQNIPEGIGNIKE